MNSGSPNGTSARSPYDRWFRYPAGFSSATLERCFEAAGEIGRDELLLDFYCGAATTGTGRAARGGRFIGLEAHPLLVNLARTKFRRPPGRPDQLRAAAAAAAEQARNTPVGDEHELVRRCFSESSLRVLCGIRYQVERSGPWAPYLTWALLGTLRDVANVAVGWPYLRPAVKRVPLYKDPAARFVQRAEAMADDLAEVPLEGRGRIRLADSRQRSAWSAALGNERFGAAITSSPYLNNFDYADATRLELYFLGQASSWREMCRIVRRRMLVATTQQSSTGQAKRSLDQLQKLPAISSEVRALVAALRSERKRRDRGKEYDLVLPSYFHGIWNTLSNAESFLKPGGRIVWVIGDSAPYGIHIKTPELICSLAQATGLEVVENERIRERGTRWRTNGTRHQVALEERMLVLTDRRH